METTRLTSLPSQSRKNGSAGSPAHAASPRPRGEDQRVAEVESSSRFVSRLDRWLLTRFLSAQGAPAISFRLWNGETLCMSSKPPTATVAMNDRGAMWKLLLDPFFQFGELYSEGRIDIVDGTVVDLLRVLDDAISGGKAATANGRRPWWPFRRNRNTLVGSQNNIHHHYDIGNAFYKLWLDEQLLYTCAYFDEPGRSIEQAQIAKMDHVCRKLWMKPGETVIEAGCGWGAFALHMARHYGVTVRAFNISAEQVSYARDRAKREGLQDRVEFIQDDWRTISGSCDMFVSIGMLEHVGTENYPELGRVVQESLNERGRGLIHSIGQNQPRPFDRWIERRIFPGAYPPTLAEMMTLFEDNRMSVLDVENIRLHYAETLAHWLERFEQSADRIAEMFDEKFVRSWRLYLAGSFAGFEGDRLQLYQVLFSPEKQNAIPRNRRYQYESLNEPQTFAQHIEIDPETEDRS